MKSLILLPILLSLSLGASAQRLPVRTMLVPTHAPLQPMRNSLTESPSEQPNASFSPSASRSDASTFFPERAGTGDGRPAPSRAESSPGVPPPHPSSGWFVPSRPPDLKGSESPTSPRNAPANDSLWFVPSSAGKANAVGRVESEQKGTSGSAPDLPSMEGLQRRLIGEKTGGENLPSLGSSPFRYPSVLKGRGDDFRMKEDPAAASMPTPSLPNSNSMPFARNPWFSAYGNSPSEPPKESPLSKALSEANKMNLDPTLDDSMRLDPINRAVLPDPWLEQVGVMDPYLVEMLPYLIRNGMVNRPPSNADTNENTP